MICMYIYIYIHTYMSYIAISIKIVRRCPRPAAQHPSPRPRPAQLPEASLSWCWILGSDLFHIKTDRSIADSLTGIPQMSAELSGVCETLDACLRGPTRDTASVSLESCFGGTPESKTPARRDCSLGRVMARWASVPRFRPRRGAIVVCPAQGET